MKQGQFVLENKYGEVVRSFHWDQPSLVLIYRQDTRRIEALANTKRLEREGIPFEVLAEAKREQIKKKALPVGKVGTLKFVEAIQALAPNVELPEEDQSEYLHIFKWTAISYVVFMAFVLTLGYFLKPEEPQEQVVKIITTSPETLEKLEKQTQQQRKNVTVDASETKPVASAKQQVAPISKNSRKVKEAKQQVTHSNTKSTGKRRGQGGFVGPEWGDPSTAGVIGVLGSENRKGTGRGGFNPANAKSTGGFGAGKGGGGYGGNGAGGIPRAIFSHGMIAANPGEGSGAPGAGGYGRAGRGGGGRTGYGSLSMVGATKAYFSPIEEEAIVEGGLDRDSIAEVIQRNMGQVVYCYEQGLQTKPSLAGRVAVQFIINGSGRVSTANVASSSLHFPMVERCITGKLKSWKFPTPKGGVNVRVTYPFALRRVSSR